MLLPVIHTVIAYVCNGKGLLCDIDLAPRAFHFIIRRYSLCVLVENHDLKFVIDLTVCDVLIRNERTRNEGVTLAEPITSDFNIGAVLLTVVNSDVRFTLYGNFSLSDIHLAPFGSLNVIIMSHVTVGAYYFYFKFVFYLAVGRVFKGNVRRKIKTLTVAKSVAADLDSRRVLLSVVNSAVRLGFDCKHPFRYIDRSRYNGNLVVEHYGLFTVINYNLNLVFLVLRRVTEGFVRRNLKRVRSENFRTLLVDERQKLSLDSVVKTAVRLSFYNQFCRRDIYLSVSLVNQVILRHVLVAVRYFKANLVFRVSNDVPYFIGEGNLYFV